MIAGVLLKMRQSGYDIESEAAAASTAGNSEDCQMCELESRTWRHFSCNYKFLGDLKDSKMEDYGAYRPAELSVHSFKDCADENMGSCFFNGQALDNF